MINLKPYRKAKGLTQKDIAKKLNIVPSTVSMWETGERNPDIIMLKRLAILLECTTDDLLKTVVFTEKEV